MSKICNREKPAHEAWYRLSGLYCCQYCNGRILDSEFIREIIAYNTPTNIKNRKETIELEFNKAMV